MMKSLQKNWKTTLGGAVVLLTGAALTAKFITPEVATAIITLATAFGLIAAKDGNVTGGTKQQ